MQGGDLFRALQSREADGRLGRRGVVDKEHVIVKRCQLTESGEHISGRDLESGDSRIHEKTQVCGLGDGAGRPLIHAVEPGADHLMVSMVGQRQRYEDIDVKQSQAISGRHPGTAR